MRTRNLTAAATLAVALTLTGCIGGDPIPTLPPTPTATPIFASEEEALAAAEEAYAAYLEMSALIASEGGVDPERIAPFVTDDQLPDELATAEYYRTNGLRVDGTPLVREVVLQQQSQLDDLAQVVIYACLDISNTRILNTSGDDVTPPRQEVGVLEVALVGRSPLELLVESSELWADSSAC